MSDESNLCTVREFKRLAFAAVAAASAAVRKIHVDDHVLRKMRSNMLLTVSTVDSLQEALLLIMHVIATRATRNKVTYADVEALITGPPTVDDSSDSETEWEAEGTLAGRPLYGVRKILASFERDGKTYYLVDWEPTEETHENIPQALIAAFKEQRRAIVDKTYIDGEASVAKRARRS